MSQPDKQIEYVLGDAVRPEGDRPTIIAHVCNDMGGWGAGFVLAISARWKKPAAAYRREDKNLGHVQVVEVDEQLWVVNMIAQNGYASPARPRSVNYVALARCLHEVGELAFDFGACVVMPRIGCGLGGGEWPIVSLLVHDALCARGVSVRVYDPLAKGGVSK